MISWTRIILAGLSLVLGLVNWRKAERAFDAGQDKAIADAALRVLDATEHGKKLREHIRSLSDEQSDQLWGDMIDGQS